MTPVTAYKGKTLAVFGLGKAGRSAVAALSAGGAAVIAWDDNESSRAQVSSIKNVTLLPPEQTPWSDMAALVLSPGIPLTHPKPHPVVGMARAANVPILCDIELLYRTCPEARYVAITGTNGKSTTTALIGHLLKADGRRVEVGGNIGTAALSLEPLDKNGIYVLELSSYQLDLLHRFRANVAVLLNITPDHLSRHGGMEGYIAAKKKIFATQQPGDHAIVAIDDGDTRAVYSELSSRKDGPRVQTVSADTPLPEGISLDGIVSLRGWHNRQNAAVAIAAAMACGVDAKTIQPALRTFPGLPHRMEQVAEMGGVRFVNDSKATNADSTARALVCFDDIYWILGGEPKEGGIASLAPHFSRIRKAYVIGQAQATFPDVLKGKVDYVLCGDLATAFAESSHDALKEGKGVVLLSPACASFDQWPNFEVRGDAFRTLSHSLQEQMGKKQCSA